MKAFFAVAICALLALASAKPEPKSIVTDIIEKIIADNRDKMADVNVPEIDLGEFGSVTDLHVLGVDKFVLVRLDDCGPLSLDVCNATITLEVGTATAQIVANNIEVPEIGVTVNGVGELAGQADNIFATVAGNLKLKGLGVELVDFTDLYINVEKITAALTGIDNQDATNAALTEKLAGYINANLANKANENKEAIIAAINAFLDTII